jgi:hypothetical protein
VRLLLFFCLSILSAQQTYCQALPDTLNKVFILDSIWTTGASKRTALKDSLSYIELANDRFEMRAVSKNSEIIDKGRISRYKLLTQENGLYYSTFYIVNRGGFKASLTAHIKEISNGVFEIHLINAWSTFDKKIIGAIGSADRIIRPVKKNYKPKSA